MKLLMALTVLLALATAAQGQTYDWHYDGLIPTNRVSMWYGGAPLFSGAYKFDCSGGMVLGVSITSQDPPGLMALTGYQILGDHLTIYLNQVGAWPQPELKMQMWRSFIRCTFVRPVIVGSIITSLEAQLDVSVNTRPGQPN
jgi:hypothetical protein